MNAKPGSLCPASCKLEQSFPSEGLDPEKPQRRYLSASNLSCPAQRRSKATQPGGKLRSKTMASHQLLRDPNHSVHRRSPKCHHPSLLHNHVQLFG